MNCKVCKIKEAHQFSSMCQSCIDKGWRRNLWDGDGEGYYKKEPKIKVYDRKKWDNAIRNYSRPEKKVVK